MAEKGEWDISQIKPEDVRVIKRKPRWTKEGSQSSVHHRKVTGDIREEGAGVGGSVNTDHQGSTEKRPTEKAVESSED